MRITIGVIACFLVMAGPACLAPGGEPEAAPAPEVVEAITLVEAINLALAAVPGTATRAFAQRYRGQPAFMVVVETAEGEDVAVVLSAQGRVLVGPPPAPLAAGDLADGLEGNLDEWEVVVNEQGETATANGADEVSAGEESLRVKFREPGLNKVHLRRAWQLNLAAVDTMLLDVFTPRGGVVVSVGFDVGNRRVFFESRSLPMLAGWNRGVAFDLTAGNFKTAGSQWRNDRALPERDNLYAVYIVVEGVQEASDVLLDGLRFEQRRVTATPPPEEAPPEEDPVEEAPVEEVPPGPVEA